MKRSQVKGFEKRRRQFEQEEQEKEQMRQAVDLQRMAQGKELMEANQRANMYSLACNILVHNSGLCIGPNMNIAKEAVVNQSLVLAQEFFKQVSELDEKLKKQLEDKQNGVENGSSKIIAG